MGEGLRRFSAYGLGGLSAVLLAGLLAAGPACADEPIKIGFGFSQTGPLAPNGKQALLGARIWEEEVNTKGGLLGRKVELVVYDDQSSPQASTPSSSRSTKSISSSAPTARISWRRHFR